MELKTLDMEIALMRHIGVRANTIVPNISWGLIDHECDLLVMTGSGYLWEIEIKVSLGDLKKDAEKPHNHFSPKIKRLYFAIPKKLENHINLIPERAGIFIVKKNEDINSMDWKPYFIEIKRRPIEQKTQSISDSDKYQLARLGTMRILGMKEKIKDYRNKAIKL